jgi:hypothetical protein
MVGGQWSVASGQGLESIARPSLAENVILSVAKNLVISATYTLRSAQGDRKIGFAIASGKNDQ